MRHEKWKVLQVSSLIAKEGEEEAGVWAASRECQGLRGFGFTQCFWGRIWGSFSQCLLCPTVCQALS